MIIAKSREFFTSLGHKKPGQETALRHMATTVCQRTGLSREEQGEGAGAGAKIFKGLPSRQVPSLSAICLLIVTAAAVRDVWLPNLCNTYSREPLRIARGEIIGLLPPTLI